MNAALDPTGGLPARKFKVSQGGLHLLTPGFLRTDNRIVQLDLLPFLFLTLPSSFKRSKDPAPEGD
jgi:hypothetical protein